MLRTLRFSTRLGSSRRLLYRLGHGRILQHTPCFLSSEASESRLLDGALLERVKKVKGALREGKFDDHGHKVPTKGPIKFTVFVVAAALVVGAIATNCETAKWQKRVVFDLNPKIANQLTWMKTSYSLQMYNQWWRSTVNRAARIEIFMVEMGKRISSDLEEEARTIARGINEWWLSLLEGQQICRQIAFCMLGIHLMRYVPVGRVIAQRYFTHDITSGRVLTLLTGQLGHSGWMHLGSNVIKLIGVGELTWFILRNKQTKEDNRLHEALSGYHFLAFYAAAGTVASLSSHLFLARLQVPKVVQALKRPPMESNAVVQQIVHTAGSSGAVSANMAVVALELASSDPSLFYFPSTDMTMGPLLLCFAIVDAIGLRYGWRRMDYAAHFGGIAFGSLYYYVGPALWDWLRRSTDWKAHLLTQEYDTEKLN